MGQLVDFARHHMIVELFCVCIPAKLCAIRNPVMPPVQQKLTLLLGRHFDWWMYQGRHGHKQTI
eukprot:4719828-Ditylum_brightwellii.AAC.1